MPRFARIKVKGEPAVYHIISRTALDGFVLKDAEKEYLLNLIKRLCSLYFTEILGFCLMGNHFHLLVRMHPESNFTDEEIKKRYKDFFKDDDENKDRELSDGQVAFYRSKWEDLSEFIKYIKQGFSRFYNKRHHRKGFFWSERFKSVIVDNGETLINCLAYIDLNPVRAGIVEKPEEYRWSSIGYHVQTDNADGFLSLDFGLAEFGYKDPSERLPFYRRYLYEKGGIEDLEKERDRDFELNEFDRFRYRTRYFIDSGIIGTKEFVDRIYQEFKHHFTSKKEKRPKPIRGLEGVYSLKRLSEPIR
jgi:REP element-mobilizing transposase RayT